MTVPISLPPFIVQITTGTVETSVGGVVVKNFEYTENIRYTAFYLLFTYFWTSEFIVAVGQVSLRPQVGKCFYAVMDRSVSPDLR